MKPEYSEPEVLRKGVYVVAHNTWTGELCGSVQQESLVSGIMLVSQITSQTASPTLCN